MEMNNEARHGKIIYINFLNATGIYIYLMFTSRERERGIYTPAL